MTKGEPRTGNRERKPSGAPAASSAHAPFSVLGSPLPSGRPTNPLYHTKKRRRCGPAEGVARGEGVAKPALAFFAAASGGAVRLGRLLFLGGRRRWGGPAALQRVEDLQAVAGQDDQPGLGARPSPAEAAEHAQAAVLLEVGVAQFHRPAPQPVHLLAGWLLQALLQALKRLFPLVALHHPTLLGVARAAVPLRATLAVRPRRL